MSVIQSLYPAFPVVGLGAICSVFGAPGGAVSGAKIEAGWISVSLPTWNRQPQFFSRITP
jgi:hypothetical protein